MAMRIDENCTPQEFNVIIKVACIKNAFADVDLNIEDKRPRYTGLIEVIEEILIDFRFAILKSASLTKECLACITLIDQNVKSMKIFRK